MNKILKVLSCLACVFAFCFLAIGYAAVQDDLSVNGSVSIEPQEQAYAVYCDTLENGSQVPYWWGGGVLAFYYGYPPKEGDCISYTIEDEPNNLKISHVYTGVEDTTAGVPWLQDKLNPREVFFDESFQTVQPLTTAKWFLKYSNLNNIRQLEYLDTSQVTSMEAMFDTCKSLKTLAFGENFNTSKVTNVRHVPN